MKSDFRIDRCAKRKFSVSLSKTTKLEQTSRISDAETSVALGDDTFVHAVHAAIVILVLALGVQRRHRRAILAIARLCFSSFRLLSITRE